MKSFNGLGELASMFECNRFSGHLFIFRGVKVTP
jgi:hypothetical protein